MQFCDIFNANNDTDILSLPFSQNNVVADFTGCFFEGNHAQFGGAIDLVVSKKYTVIWWCPSYIWKCLCSYSCKLPDCV